MTLKPKTVFSASSEGTTIHMSLIGFQGGLSLGTINNQSMRQQYRQRRQPIFSRPLSRNNSPTANIKASNSAILPDIYTKQPPYHIAEVPLSSHNDVRRQIGKVMTFRKCKITCLESAVYQRLPEQIEAVSYSSLEYGEKLILVNQILASCDLTLKQRDIMVAQGRRSEAKYIFFTNFSYHPQSLCCERPVILKCVQKRGIELERERGAAKVQLICAGCFKTLLKLRQKGQKGQNREESYQKRMRLLEFSLHVASGRYKRHLLEDDPASQEYQHVRSRFSKAKVRRELQSLS